MRNLLILGTAVIFGVSAWIFWPKSNLSTARQSLADVMTQLMPPKIVAYAKADKFQVETYKKVLVELGSDKKFHEKTGHSLYRLAFTEDLSAEEKIKVLLMAKEHALFAKKLGGSNE